MNKLLVTPLLLLLSIPAMAGDQVVIIVNSSNNQQLSRQDAKNIYSDKITKWSNGKSIQVYNLPVESESRDNFTRTILGISPREAASLEANRKITNTLQNPTFTKRERLVVSIISKRPQAIGYASKKAVKGKSGIRIVLTLD